MFDLILKGGTVVDGTGNPRYAADVAVHEGRIAAVGDLGHAEAAKVLDVAGKIVSPGFIDCHSHSDLQLFVHPEAKEKIAQGFTTEVLGQDGLSLAPVVPGTRDALKRYTRTLTGPFDVEWDWRSFADYLEKLGQREPAINVACYVGHNTVRVAAMGFARRAPRPEELEEMRRLVRQGMEQGALGLSSGLIYQPGCYGDTDELVALCQVVAEFGGVHTSHVRSESDQILESFNEMLEISRRSGVKTNISHLKVAGKPNWGKAPEALAILETCAREGFGGTGDQYPYEAGNTMLVVTLPPWALEGGVQATLERIRSRDARDRIRKDYETGLPGWDSIVRAIGWENIMVNSVARPGNKEYEGKTMAEIARSMGADPVDALCDFLIADDGASTMIVFQQDGEDHETLIRYPGTMFGTDGIFVEGKPHPRLYGTVPRILGRYVREKGLFSLEEAVRKGAHLPAQVLGLKDIGLIRPGMWADIIVFDEQEVIDQATYEQPTLPNRGIGHVIVSGTIVLENGEHTGARPGRIVRRGE